MKMIQKLKNKWPSVGKKTEKKKQKTMKNLVNEKIYIKNKRKIEVWKRDLNNVMPKFLKSVHFDILFLFFFKF